MSADDRRAMIAGMVTGLADRLATEGGPAPDWAQLIVAYGVLGEIETAQEIFNEALQVFNRPPADLEILKASGAIGGHDAMIFEDMQRSWRNRARHRLGWAWTLVLKLLAWRSLTGCSAPQPLYTRCGGKIF